MKLPKILLKALNFKRRDSSKKSMILSTNLGESKTLDFKNRFKNITKKTLQNCGISLFYAIIFSLPIYINIFSYLSIDILNGKNGIFLPYINAIFALISVFVALNIDRKYRFFFGFFVGILWFYWMVLSFRYSPVMSNFMAISVIIIGIVYGIVFYFLLFFDNKFWRVFTISVIGYVAILGFDWLIIESLFAFSVFRVDKISFIFILLCVALFSIMQSKKRIFALCALVFAIDFSYVDVKIPPNVSISQMDVNQQVKWGEEEKIVAERNFGIIDEAIKKGDKMVILPETAFPFALYGYVDTFTKLKEKSYEIIIITGSWWVENSQFFNSTYIFENGEVQIMKKTFLAPFGEYVPLPNFIAKIVSKITGFRFDSLAQSKDGLNDVKTGALNFRSAICYEVTKKEMYKDNPKFMIAISNNAWFSPSIEPILQMMIIKYYARLHKTLVIHTVNGTKSMVISPNTSLKFIADF